MSRFYFQNFFTQYEISNLFKCYDNIDNKIKKYTRSTFESIKFIKQTSHSIQISSNSMEFTKHEPSSNLHPNLLLNEKFLQFSEQTKCFPMFFHRFFLLKML